MNNMKNMLTKEKLGKRIKAIRKKKKITQEQLAEMIDVDCGYISKLEVGLNYPSLETLNKIAIALKTDIAEFFINYNEVDFEKEALKSFQNLTTNQQAVVYNLINSMNFYSTI